VCMRKRERDIERQGLCVSDAEVLYETEEKEKKRECVLGTENVCLREREKGLKKGERLEH
jgi:hypothetical protein